MEFSNIYLVRHGRIKTGESEKYFIGQTDLPMDDAGKKQCERIGKILERFNISSVYCSDLIRSVDAAEIISDNSGITPVIVPLLREISLGEWDGLSFAEIISKYPDEFRKRGKDIVNFRPPGGESFHDCGERVIPVFKEIVNISKGNIIIAGHAGINRLILCYILGLPFENLFNISQDYGCINIIFAGSDHYRLILLNETGSI